MPVHVAVPVPFLPLLTYDVPEGMPPPVRGARVLVPLGTRHVTGCVVAVDALATADVEPKPIVDVLDASAFLPGHVIDLALWAAEYYAAGPGETVAAAMPPFAWVESERRVSITEAGRTRLAQGGGREGAALVVLRALADGRSFTPRELGAAAGGARGSLDAVIRTLIREGLVISARALKGKVSSFRTFRVISLTVQGQELAARASAAALAGTSESAVAALGGKQSAMLMALSGSPRGLPVRALKDRGIGGAPVKRWAARGLASVREERRERAPFVSVAALAAGERPPAVGPAAGSRVLTPEQSDAFARMQAHIARGQFHVAL